MMRCFVIGFIGVLLTLGVGVAQVQPSGAGVVVSVHGLSKQLRYAPRDHRASIAHIAAMPNPDTNRRTDVLVYALYVPATGEIRATCTVGSSKTRVTIRRTGSYGGRSVAHLVIDPFDGYVLVGDSLVVKVDWEGTLQPLDELTPPNSAPFLNASWGPPQAVRKFTSEPVSQRNVDPRTWYRKDGAYVRIETSRDGIARISVEEVLKHGGFDSLKSIALFWRGQEQPLYILDSDSSGTLTLGDAVYFRGRRAQGDTTWLDIYDSTSVYYLTGTQREGMRKRYRVDDTPLTSSSRVGSVQIREHFELDTGYYHPGSGIDNDHSIFLTPTALFEGFYWKNLYGRSKEWELFPLRYTPADSGWVRITADVVTTTDSKKYDPEHIVDVAFPAPSLQTAASPLTSTFDGYERRAITTTVPTKGMPSGAFNVSVMATGSEELRAQSDWYSEVLVDGFTIEGASIPVLDSGRLRCSFSTPAPSALTVYNVEGDSIVIVDTVLGSIRFVPTSERGSTIRVALYPDHAPSEPWNQTSYAGYVCMGAAEQRVTMASSLVLFRIHPVSKAITVVQFPSSSECLSALAQVPVNEVFVLVNTGITASTELRAELARRGVPVAELDANTVWTATAAEGNGKVSLASGMTAFLPSVKGRDGMALVPVEIGQHDLLISSMGAIESARVLPAKNHAISLDERSSDIIAIAHPTHLAQASRWAAHRFATSGRSVVLYDAQAVFEEYDAGRHTPDAIKAFLTDRWKRAQKKPTHCVLIGNASWDQRQAVKSGNVSATRIDQVPTYGKPSSDMWYGLIDDEFDVATPELIVSRFPVTTEAECRSLVDKIIATDTTPYNPYQRKFMYVGGGKENENFCDIYQRLLDDFSGSEIVFTKPPLCIDTVTVCALDHPNPGADIKRALQDGVGWMNYIGHGGTDVFDIAGWEPEDLTNRGRYPVLATFSCLTGNYASPASLCENATYLLADSRGMVATVGATGYQYIAVVDLLHYRFHEAMLTKKMRTVGELTYEAKRAFALTTDQYGINSTLQYCLLGDPFTRVRIDTAADVLVTPASINVRSVVGDPTVFLQQDSFYVDVDVWNQGLATNAAFDVRLIHCTYGAETSCDTLIQTIQPEMCSSQILRYVLPTREVGRHTISISLDVFESIDDSPINDTATIAFTVENRSFLIVEPDKYAVLERHAVHTRCISPYMPSNSSSDSASLAFYASVDDIRIGKQLPSRIVSVTRKGAVTDIVAIVDSARQFVRDSMVVYLVVQSPTSPMVVRPITLAGEAGAPSLHYIPATAARSTPSMIVFDSLSNTISIAKRPVSLSLQSSGATTADPVKIPAVRFTLGDSVYVQSSYRSGLNIAVIRPFSTIPRCIRRYDTSPNPSPRETGHSGSAPECIAFLRDSIADHEIVAIAACTESFTQFEKTGLFGELRSELKAFGSVLSDSLSIGSSFAFIGSRSWNPSSVIERWHGAPSSVVRIDTAVLLRYSAAVADSFSVVKPARIDSLRLSSFDSSVVAHVQQEYEGGALQTDTIVGTWKPPLAAPFLTKLTTRVILLPRDKNPNPTLHGSTIIYEPSPVLYVDSSMIRYEPAIPTRGDSVTVGASVWNLRTLWKSTFVSLEYGVEDATRNASPTSDTGRLETLAPNQEHTFVRTLKLDPSWSRARAFSSVVAPSVSRSMYSMYQHASLSVSISEDTIAPRIEVLSDQRVIVPKTFVPETPLIEVRVFDDALLPITSVDKLVVFVNGQRIRQGTVQDFEFLPTADAQRQNSDPSIRAIMRFRFPMEVGENLLIVRAKDASNNGDTLEIPIIYNPEDQLREVVVGPNPTAGETTFNVHVSGASGQLSAELQVHDLQGRSIIRTREPLSIGWNTLRWNGLTPLGDTPVLGAYVWHLSLRNAAGEPLGKGLSGPLLIVR